MEKVADLQTLAVMLTVISVYLVLSGAEVSEVSNREIVCPVKQR